MGKKRKAMTTYEREEYSFDHVRQRVKERYTEDLTREEYDELNVRARKAKAKDWGLVEESGGKTQRIIPLLYKGLGVLFVFDEERDYITTALPQWLPGSGVSAKDLLKANPPSLP